MRRILVLRLPVVVVVVKEALPSELAHQELESRNTTTDPLLAIRLHHRNHSYAGDFRVFFIHYFIVGC